MFPARAGMSRLQHGRRDLCRGVPRASGDEPGTRGLVPRSRACSPRERG